MSDILTFVRLDCEAEGFTFRGLTLAEAREREIEDAIILPAVQAWLCVEIDRHAEVLRQSVTTPGAGQAMEYQEAQAQAELALAAGGTPQATDYPMLAATLGIDLDPETGQPATTILGVARSVSAAKAAWGKFGAAVRGARLSGKAAVNGASAVEAAAAAFDAIVWPTAS